MRELGGTRVRGSGMVVRAWAMGLRREEVTSWRDVDGAGGGGMFVFDGATGVLTFAEALGGNGASSL